MAIKQLGWGTPSVLLVLLWKGAPSKTGRQPVTGWGNFIGRHRDIHWISFSSASSLWQVRVYLNKAAPHSSLDHLSARAKLIWITSCAQVTHRAPMPQQTHGNLCTCFAFQMSMHILLVEILICIVLTEVNFWDPWDCRTKPPGLKKKQLWWVKALLTWFLFYQ